MLVIFFFHRFAIDIAFSAVSLSYLLAKIFSIDLEPAFLLLLFFSTNATYNLDRFFDNAKGSPITNPYLLFFLAGLSLIGATAIFEMELLKNLNHLQVTLVTLQIIMLGSYFFVVHKKPKLLRRLLGTGKEVAVALLFSVGCFLPIFLSSFENALTSLSEHPTTYIGFFLVILHNALLFSFFNYKKDESQKQTSLVTVLPKEKSAKLFVALGLLALIFLLSYPPPDQSGHYRYYLPTALAVQGLLFRIFMRKTSHGNDANHLAPLSRTVAMPQTHSDKNSRLLFACVGDGHFTVLLIVFFLIAALR